MANSKAVIKQKAELLVSEMMIHVPREIVLGTSGSALVPEGMRKIIAKKCALVAIGHMRFSKTLDTELQDMENHIKTMQ